MMVTLLFLIMYCKSVCNVHFLSQTWDEHFFVLTETHLNYTEKQEEDESYADEGYCGGEDEVGYPHVSCVTDFSAVLCDI